MNLLSSKSNKFAHLVRSHAYETKTIIKSLASITDMLRHKTKACHLSENNYKQRFFAIFRYFISSASMTEEEEFILYTTPHKCD